MDDSLDVVVLAAGKGMRMRSHRPKVLHSLAGLPLLEHVLRTAFSLSPQRVVVVVGHGGDAVRAAFAERGVMFVDQGEPRGTGHAVLAAREAVAAGTFLVLPGDVPLVPPEALRALVRFHRERNATVSFLTMEPAAPGPYGRVVRGEDGKPLRIVEAGDATPEERAVRELNSGIWCLENAPAVWEALGGLSTANVKGELYLTDLVARFAEEGTAAALPWPDADDLLGVNDRADLALLERLVRERILTAWMRDGVTVTDPSAVYPSLDAAVGEDTVLHPGTHLLGRTVIGPGCTVGPNAYLIDSRVGEEAQVWYSVVEGAEVGPEARIGPYAHLRPGSRIGRGAKVGNFVEVKAATLGDGVKAGHLAYIGDAEVGAGANIGAGAITCNFQPGRREKFRTEVGPRAFIGSNVSLVAPVRIGEGAVVGAGSVITHDVPPYALALGRAREAVTPGWARPAEEGGHA
ncbi:MAG: bifunctional UDP-N-acetylglucosamine diphosphorylase/glucosamine-1-phosphate N-acetyltransferase GlmU [Candidatus Bipolaricaulis sp.]|jgi:bifunctional UDP-N-acetylglucosamine pyrophosphorylase/glucosamine-1-phosphate N-acetyltransferase|uniref:Bifunctional protein GlmU n=1 Tax=Candidatus Bipolaricaulis anaerobius TaxID=2026885 RepID=A0A2X3KUI5_9BACT|nr:bifunctional UDP-N-acetylglucosamine diphosphorylase/glucosamine-1-phosphate N-acetyltransferase GlmU [Candidatus Bipolaricaulis anaerobius]MBP7726298.1 bifunctional UDP-N-acetylglucosamine diphosphorylase/glucosamine-1-phosphate N-acetyltransferase GlmU [Candidatus Bipolaricaulis sp.]SQD92268.1 Bifunctional protein GlmU [Includes: UDP-N-acetylglucosamine pyrophosphorylase; Glucosamine-1-phosphate N-acetyltransferase] [Candidatus Bipolaricaulis anaerobius]HOD73137.1 bifunctional UDP-N-acetylg